MQTSEYICMVCPLAMATQLISELSVLEMVPNGRNPMCLQRNSTVAAYKTGVCLISMSRRSEIHDSSRTIVKIMARTLPFSQFHRRKTLPGRLRKWCNTFIIKQFRGSFCLLSLCLSMEDKHQALITIAVQWLRVMNVVRWRSTSEIWYICAIGSSFFTIRENIYINIFI